MKTTRPKTLIIVAHPDVDSSSTQSFLYSIQQKIPGVKWHNINTLFEHNNLDIRAEKKLLSQYDRILFQFPLYWYSSPASLKFWEDKVLDRNFAFEKEKGVLQGKELGLVISLGTNKSEYEVGRKEGYTMSQLTIPYQALAKKLGMKFLSTLVISQFAHMNLSMRQHLLVDYYSYLTSYNPFSLRTRSRLISNYLLKLLSLKKDSRSKKSLRLLTEKINNNNEELTSLTAQLRLIKNDEESND